MGVRYSIKATPGSVSPASCGHRDVSVPIAGFLSDALHSTHRSILVAKDWAQKLIVSQPCRHGHAPVRYVSNGICVECMRLRVESWKRRHPSQPKARYTSEQRRHINAINGRLGGYARWKHHPTPSSKQIPAVPTGAGKRFIVKGPGIPIDPENDWAESTAILHVAALNAAFEAGRAPTSSEKP